MVVYDGGSLWLNAAQTITAGWIRTGGNVSYTTYTEFPEDVRVRFRKFGLDTEKLEREDRLRIWDSYTVTLGQKSKEKCANDSLKVSDLSIRFAREQMTPQPRPDVLRIGDSASTALRFNDEKSFVEFVLSRGLPSVRLTKTLQITAYIRGAHSDWLYKQLEAAHDGIIDFKLEEVEKRTKTFMRIRSMRDVPHDSEWHRLKIAENSEVILEK